ncbi:MAG TPA: hypothetical protein VJ302_19130 [Blastocatellia bacterium]|nr:hypothetical protein [Blastocatellia bacterium]
MKVLFSVACLLALSLTAFAQDTPRIEVFGGYSYLRTDGENTDLTQFGGTGTATQKGANLNGFNAAFAFNPTSRIGIVADAGGAYGTIKYAFTSGGTTVTIPASTSFYTFLFGPQANFRGDRNTFFVRPLAGFIHGRQRVPGQVGTATDTAFAAAFGGGFDRKVSDSISIRIFQADYLLTTFDEGARGNGVQSNLRFSTGFVFGK